MWSGYSAPARLTLTSALYGLRRKRKSLPQVMLHVRGALAATLIMQAKTN